MEPDANGEGRGDPEHLVVGHISKPHGTRGEVFIWPLTDRPETVFAPGGALLLGDEAGSLEDVPEVLTVERVRPFKRGELVKFDGRDDREAVEALAGRYVLVPIERIEPLEDGEVFYHQLLGLAVSTKEGAPVGVVSEVYETAPAHLLEVRGSEGDLHLIPFTKRIVKRVDVDAGTMVIDPPAGLLEI